MEGQTKSMVAKKNVKRNSFKKLDFGRKMSVVVTGDMSTWFEGVNIVVYMIHVNHCLKDI